MKAWRPQSYLAHGRRKGIPEKVLESAVAASDEIAAVDSRLAPLLTLGHLSYLTDVHYTLLRDVVRRQRLESYRAFHIRKRSTYRGRKQYRLICVPEPALLRAQTWITQRILAFGTPHAASVAYSKGSSVLRAAEGHCGCRWLIKVDLRSFFESISEISVYRVFRGLGYQALLSFELARLCTRTVESRARSSERWRANADRYNIEAYRSTYLGHLPQGAPTSPMLSNLAVRELDHSIQEIAANFGLRYSRYADDIILSTQRDEFDRDRAKRVVHLVYGAIARFGLTPNRTKTSIRGPGARKLVLGLLVDGDVPRLPREFKSKMRMHLYFLSHPSVGPAAHAARRGFSAVAGLRHHLEGLAAFAAQIEPEYADRLVARLRSVPWPT